MSSLENTAPTKTPMPLWRASGDFLEGADVKEYQAALGEIKQQFLAEYPDAARKTIIIDPSRPTKEQWDEYVQQATKSGTLNPQDLEALKLKLAEAQDTLNQNFHERGSADGRLVSLTADATINGEKFHIIIATPPDSQPLETTLRSVAHEINHVISLHDDDHAVSIASIDKATVHGEWGAVLAEYSYAYAANPSSKTLEHMRLNFASRQAGVMATTPDNADKTLPATYPYAVTDEAFYAMLQETQKRLAAGEAPSLHLANEVSQSILAKYGPDDATIKSDIAAIKQGIAMRAELIAAHPGDEFKALEEFHQKLAASDNPVLNRIAKAQDEKALAIATLYPKEALELQQTGAVFQAPDTVLKRSQAVDSFAGVANIESDGKDHVLVGFHSANNEAILGIDTDHNAATGQSGYDTYAHIRDDGTVSYSKTLEGQIERTERQASPEELALFDAARLSLKDHETISMVDKKLLTELGSKLGGNLQQVNTGAHVAPASTSAQTAPEASLGR